MEVRYLQVADALRRQIDVMGPNTLLPTEEQLGRRFGVSRVTIRLALGLLERSGLVSRQRGRGTIVNPPKITRRLSPLHGFEDDLREQGIKFETQVIAYKARSTPPDLFRRLLRLPARASVGFLSLVRVVDGLIVAHDCRYFPAAIASRFDPVLAHDHAISDIVADLAGGPATTVDWESEIIPSPAEVAALLGLTSGALIVANTFTYYAAGGSPLEAGIMSYRIDRCKFKFAERLAQPLQIVGATRRREGRRVAPTGPEEGRRWAHSMVRDRPRNLRAAGSSVRSPRRR